MLTKSLGRSGIQVSAIGLGCLAIGGPWTFNGRPAGWGKVNDAESIRAIHCALDLGVNFLDTAANYGAGHSERVVGQALAGRRDQVVVATKFGYAVDEDARNVTTCTDVVASIHQACEASLHRLGTDYIDLYQFHVENYDPIQSAEVRDVLEDLVAIGKIRAYGWNTDNPEGARVFAQGLHCTAIQYMLNAVTDTPQMLAVCEEFNLAGICRSPLASGILSGKITPNTQFPEDDIRGLWLTHDEQAREMAAKASLLRGLFDADRRTLVQRFLAWILARSPRTIPIPGFRTMAQVKENLATLEFSPLNGQQMQTIDQVFGRAST